jgi:hypothetical protein
LVSEQEIERRLERWCDSVATRTAGDMGEISTIMYINGMKKGEGGKYIKKRRWTNFRRKMRAMMLMTTAR